MRTASIRRDSRPAPVWAVANQKGGVGKTTTAVSLAGELVRRGRRVLVVDLDPHGSMTTWFGLDPEETVRSVYALFQAVRPDAVPDVAGQIVTTGIAGIDLVPASTAQATLDRQLGAERGMGLVLQRALAGVRRRYDCLLLDCPPMLGVLMVNALAACDRLLIPVQTEFLALKGLERMLRTLEMIRRSRGRLPEYLVLPTLFDRRTRAANEALAHLRAHHARHLWHDLVPIDTRFREASRRGVPLPLWQPASRGARAYARLADTLLGASRDADAPQREVAG